MSEGSNNSTTGGIGAGSIIGMLLCWFKWHSVWALIWPVIFGWFYVIYYALLRDWPMKLKELYELFRWLLSDYKLGSHDEH